MLGRPVSKRTRDEEIIAGGKSGMVKRVVGREREREVCLIAAPQSTLPRTVLMVNCPSLMEVGSGRQSWCHQQLQQLLNEDTPPTHVQKISPLVKHKRFGDPPCTETEPEPIAINSKASSSSSSSEGRENWPGSFSHFA